MPPTTLKPNIPFSKEFSDTHDVSNPGAIQQWNDANPLPKVTPTVPGAETIGTSPVRRYTGTPSPYQSESEKYYAGLNKTAPDEATIRQQMRDEVQGQLDSINNGYVSIFANEARNAENRVGATRATDARSGTLGSDFGNADAAKTADYNLEKKAAIQARRDAEINAVLTGVRERADAKIKEDKNAALKNNEDHLTYLKGNQESARTDVTTLAKSGIHYDELTDEEYKNLLDQSGYTPEQLHAQFIINKPDDKVLTSFTQGNKYYQVTQDPVTGKKKTESIDLGFEVPVDWKEAKLDNGILFYNPKDPTQQHTYTAAPSEKDALELENKRLQNTKLRKEINTPSNSFKFTNDDTMKLVNTGLTSEEVSALQSDIQAHGADVALQGLPDNQQKTVRSILSGGKNDTQFLTPEFFKTQFANTTIDDMLKTMGKERSDYAKFFQGSGKEEENIKKDFNTYIDGLIPTIESYRQAGYTDKEILNLMK